VNEAIRKRKSIRTFEQTKLDWFTLTAIREKITQVKPLVEDIRFSIEIVEKTKGILDKTAPYYLLFRSEKKRGCYENIGFIGQQMDLFLSESGIGSCWRGFAKPVKKELGKLPFMIGMAFGKPAGPLYRELSEFRRKPLSAISEGADERLEAARLAPSGMNAQNWYFIAKDGKIYCYYRRLAFLYNKYRWIDLGIAMYHIASESESFNYVKETDAPERRGYVYVGTIC